MAVKFSIIIPVFRETAIINRTIDTIMALNDHDDLDDLEIIVVDGRADGDTIKEIKHDEVIKIISPKGRGRQFNCGAAKATGDVLIFLHADTILPATALDRISEVMKNIFCIGGAFDLSIESDRFAFRIIEIMGSLRSRLTRLPYGDQAIFIRTDFFRKIGGFKEIPLMEDVELMQRIKKNKAQIIILKDRVLTSPRRWEKEGIIFCTLRNWLLAILFSLGIKPETLARFYK
ncbi:MAG: TIGR04283 family arsenosugar biosynthesis glycosyltransferase [Smithella sp.]|jgi:rSAM/selenodomain-associated transferase 2